MKRSGNRRAIGAEVCSAIFGKRAALCLAGSALFCFALGAQDFRARLTVTVTDPGGNFIPGAALELQNTSTMGVLSAKTNEIGLYTFLFVQPGTFTLKVSAPGFKPAQRQDIVLQSFQASGIEVRLEVGEVTESITVTSEAPLLGTESASRGVVVDSQLVNDLPVPNHNPMMLGLTLPGVYMRPLGMYTDPWTITSQFTINGGLTQLNEFQVDGAPNNAQFANNVYAYSPPNEAVQEMSVQGNMYDSQYGHTSGGVINVSTKSGTSDFHGQGWTYLKRTGWNANSFQNNAIGAPRAPAPQDQWGFQVAGPLNFPKIIPKSDNLKIFYLFSWDKYHELLPNPLNLSYPEPEMRTGDFSRLTNAAGQLIMIYDPSSGHTDASGNFVRDPFTSNTIPSNRISPVSRAVTALMPLPTLKKAGVRYSTQNLPLGSNVHYWDFWNWLARVDFNFGSKYRLFVRPASMRFDELSNYNGIDGPGKRGGVFSRYNTMAALVDWVGTLSPSLVVNIRANFARYGEGWHSPENYGYDLSKLGLPSSFISQLYQPALFGGWNFDGYTYMGQSVNWNNTNTYSLAGSVNKFAGGHNLRAGMDVRLIHYISYSTGYPFSFTSSADYTRRLWNDSSSESTSGDSFATFLLGTPSSGSAIWNVSPFFRSWYLAPWFQDDWKVSRRLTLNFGLRYDLSLPPDEKYDRMNIGFDTAVPNPVAKAVPPDQVQLYPYLGQLAGGIQFAGVSGNRTRATLTDLNNIQPRVGIAYQIKPRLVFRGGYGLYYTNFQSNNMMQSLGFSSTTTLVTSLDGGRTAIPNLLNNPYPDGVAQPSGASLGAATYVGQSFTQWNGWFKLPRAHQFSAGFQYQLTRSSVIDMSYVGNRTVAYSANRNLNLPPWSFAQQCDMAQAGGKRSYCDAQVNNPLKGIELLKGTSLYSSSTISRFNLARPFTEFSDITQSGENLGHMWYNGLQINFNQRLTHGLILNVSHVWSKQIEQWGWMNQYLKVPQRSAYTGDHPNVFKVSAAYNLPVGKGRKFTLASNRVLDIIAGGWQIAPTFFIQNGERANLPGNAIRLRNSDVKDISWNQYKVRGWGACVLNMDTNGNITPMPYSVQTYGCSATDFSQYDWLAMPVLSGQQVSPSGSGQLHMKRYVYSNLALSKDIAIVEKLTLRLRMEATNVLNHFNYLTARFNTTPTDPNFGTSIPSTTAGLDAPPRVIQIGAKVNW
jgi:hypothetical protein